MNEYLWDNYEERLPKDEYKKLVGWIKDKERLADRSPEPPAKDNPAKTPKERDSFEFQGDKYSKKDDYEKLTGLASKLRDNEERLPFEDYQKLRGWIERADRERWSGALEKQIVLTHQKFERSNTKADLKAVEGGRVLDPQPEHLMRNPIVGLFMTEAAIASEIVRSIPLDDRNRDYLKENRDALEDAKKGLDEKVREQIKMPWEISKSQEERDREAQEKIDKAIEENEKAKEREREEKKRKREERDRDDWDRFDPWGRF